MNRLSNWLCINNPITFQIKSERFSMKVSCVGRSEEGECAVRAKPFGLSFSERCFVFFINAIDGPAFE